MDALLINRMEPKTAVPVDFRAQIRARLKMLGESTYWLAELLNGKVTRSAIYNYLRKKSPSEIGADKLEAILNALEEAERKRQAANEEKPNANKKP
jgi:hypothetical protein